MWIVFLFLPLLIGLSGRTRLSSAPQEYSLEKIHGDGANMPQPDHETVFSDSGVISWVSLLTVLVLFWG